MVCEFCGGSGEHPFIPDMECDICYGQGKIGQSIEVDLSRKQVEEEEQANDNR